MVFDITNLICAVSFGLCGGMICASASGGKCRAAVILAAVIFSAAGIFDVRYAYMTVPVALFITEAVISRDIGEAFAAAVVASVSSFAVFMLAAAITSPAVEAYSYPLRAVFYYSAIRNTAVSVAAAAGAPVVIFGAVRLRRASASGGRLAVCTLSVVIAVAVIMLLHMCIGSFIDYNAKLFKTPVSFSALICAVSVICVIMSLVFASGLRRKVSQNLGEMKEFYIIPAAVICTILFYCYENAVLNNHTTFDAPMYKYTVSILIVMMIATMLAALIAVCTYMLRERAERSHIEKQVELTEMYRNEIRGIRREIFDFKHDYVKIYSSMSRFIVNGEYDKLRDFFDRNIVPLQKELINTSEGSEELAMIEDEAIQGLIYSYLIKAKKSGVDLITDIRDNIPVSSVPVIDLNRILGIFLDNAIEHSLKSDRTVCFAAVRHEDCTMFVITNRAESVDMERMFRYGESTKGKGRGRGLAIARRICAAHDELSMNTYLRNGKFVCEIYVGDDGNE